jgi:hypothetical protein
MDPTYANDGNSCERGRHVGVGGLGVWWIRVVSEKLSLAIKLGREVMMS